MTMDIKIAEAGQSSFAPEISERAAQPYFAVATQCRRDEIGAKVSALLDELHAWFERHGVTPNGPQVIRYRVVDYNTGNVKIEVGLPVETDNRPADSRIQSGEIPAGRYVTVVHAGPYESLVNTTAALLAWARENRMVLEFKDHEKASQWGCRVERYLVAPPDESRPERWRTEIDILLSDAADTGRTFNQPRNVT